MAKKKSIKAEAKASPKAAAKKRVTVKKTKARKSFLKKDFDIFKERLFNFKDDVLSQIKDISEDTLMKSQKEISGDISGYSLHMADVASDNYTRDFNLSLVSSEHRVLMDIEDALKRVEDKTYGVCLSCNRMIAKTRLKAIPYARYCTKCKTKLEKENKV